MNDNTDERRNEQTEVVLGTGEGVRVRTHLPEGEMRYLGDLLREQARLAAEMGAAFTRIRSIDQEILSAIVVEGHLQKISPEDGSRVTAAFTHGLGERGIGHLAAIAMVGIREAKSSGGDR